MSKTHSFFSCYEGASPSLLHRYQEAKQRRDQINSRYIDDDLVYKQELEDFSSGQFDAIIGANPSPELIKKAAYRDGYASKFFEMIFKKYGIEMTNEF